MAKSTKNRKSSKGNGFAAVIAVDTPEAAAKLREIVASRKRTIQPTRKQQAKAIAAADQQNARLRDGMTASERAMANTASPVLAGPSVLSLRPGMLISLSCRMRGGVSYRREDIEAKKIGETKIDEWQTERRVEDYAEYTEGTAVRNKCRNLISAACLKTPFGLVCVKDRFADLESAIREAARAADEFNTKAKHSQVVVYMIRGRIEQSDTQAMRAIGGELRNILSDMRASVGRADVAAIREAAIKARELGKMIDATQGEKITAAVKAAREAAKEILRRVEKEGEDKATVVQSLQLDSLAENRFAWLDVDVETPTQKEGA